MWGGALGRERQIPQNSLTSSNWESSWKRNSCHHPSTVFWRKHKPRPFTREVVLCGQAFLSSPRLLLLIPRIQSNPGVQPPRSGALFLERLNPASLQTSSDKHPTWEATWTRHIAPNRASAHFSSSLLEGTTGSESAYSSFSSRIGGMEARGQGFTFGQFSSTTVRLVAAGSPYPWDLREPLEF